MGLKAIVDAKSDTPKLSDVSTLVSDYAKAWWDEKDAKAKKGVLKTRILALHKQSGVNSFDGKEGNITVIYSKDSMGLVTKAVKDLLTEEQIEECTGVTRKGSIKVEFKPAVKRPGE